MRVRSNTPKSSNRGIERSWFHGRDTGENRNDVGDTTRRLDGSLVQILDESAIPGERYFLIST